MPHISVPHRCTDAQYRAARAELDELFGADVGVPAGAQAVDALLARIENYEGTMRFVPDWDDESFQHAA